MSRIISMLAKLSFLGVTAAVIGFAPAPAAAAPLGPGDCLQTWPDCPPMTLQDCVDFCINLYPENDGLTNDCRGGKCVCAC